MHRIRCICRSGSNRKVSNPSEEVAIVGIHATPITKKRNRSIRESFARIAIATLKDAGVEPKEVDGLVTTPPGINPDLVIMYGAFLGKYLGLDTRMLQVIENGGATSALALRAAANEIALGRVKRCLVVSADERYRMNDDMDQMLRFGASANIGLQGSYDGIYVGGFPVPIYAMSGQRYMHEYDVSSKELAELVVHLRNHASRHPGAQFQKPTTVEEVLGSPIQSAPLTLHMCCPVSTGGAGVLLTTVTEAKKLGRPFTRIASFGGYHEAEHFLPVSLDRDFTTYRSAINASKQAYDMAGVGPKDLDVAEIYGVYAPTELMLYEDLGFAAEKGSGAQAVRDGRLTHGGDLVVNPTGGRIAYGHPAAATPLLETVEIAHQLRGTATGRQVDGARWGLTHAEHGCLNGSVVTTYEAMA